MDSDNINIKILKIIIFEIAKNNGTTLPEMVKNKKLKSELVRDHVIFLKNLDYLTLRTAKLCLQGRTGTLNRCSSNSSQT